LSDSVSTIATAAIISFAFSVTAVIATAVTAA